jgi:pimeloyl-ACP methyl ester carboxylesterase
LKVTAEDLARRYASLPDDELLLMNWDDLTELARSCYDAELRRRGLVEPEPEPAPQAAATFADPNSAALAKQVIEAGGIECFLENENGGVRLMVAARVVNRARGLLEEDQDAAAPAKRWDGTIAHRFVETNGIRMHYAEAGTGPLVILCHGFPECWHSWRHQLPALAFEGYRAVAPDLRGFGQTDRPPAVEAYDILHLAGDLVGLVNALGDGPAILVGHDWGAVLAWHAALLRPNLFHALVLMSVPYVPRRKMSQSQWEAEKYPGRIFYQADLRSPHAETFFESDIRTRLLRGLWLLSGDAPSDKCWQPVRDPDVLPAAPALPARLPRWLTEADLDFLEGEYRRTGFSGGLNYYRNCDRNWELTPFLEGARLPQPTLFLAGEKDPVLDLLGEEYAALENHVPNLWKKALIPRAGHWIQQERPEDVNLLLLDFLHELERSGCP